MVRGIVYNYYRDYDPSLGLYIQSDLIGLRGGMNTYGYVYQNPVNKVDPYGLFVLNPASGAGAGFAIGGPSGAAVRLVVGGVALFQIGNVLSEWWEEWGLPNPDDYPKDRDKEQ